MDGVFLNGVSVRSLVMVETKLVQWNAKQCWLITGSALHSVLRTSLRPAKFVTMNHARQSGLWVTGQRWVILFLLLFWNVPEKKRYFRLLYNKHILRYKLAYNSFVLFCFCCSALQPVEEAISPAQLSAGIDLAPCRWIVHQTRNQLLGKSVGTSLVMGRVSSFFVLMKQSKLSRWLRDLERRYSSYSGVTQVRLV